MSGISAVLVFNEVGRSTVLTAISKNHACLAAAQIGDV
jgi:hypothetical protein